MKLVYSSHRELAHVWAGQKREEGRSGSMFFHGRTIYSYGTHFPIAAFTDTSTPDGTRRVVLFNSAGYSNSTAKHKSHTRMALHGLPVRVFDVPHVLAAEYGDATEHAANLAAYVNAREASILAAARARTYGETHLRLAASAEADAIAYAAAFGLQAPTFEPVTPELVAAAKARAAEADKARAAAGKAQREAREAADAKREAEAAEERARVPAHAEAWKAGGPWTRELSRHYDGPTLLRLRGSQTGICHNVETSRGAVVPRDVAPFLWAAACHARGTGSGMAYPPGAGVDVGDFSLRAVRADGSLVIGCHELTWEVIRDFCERVLGLPAYVEREGVQA